MGGFVRTSLLSALVAMPVGEHASGHRVDQRNFCIAEIYGLILPIFLSILSDWIKNAAIEEPIFAQDEPAVFGGDSRPLGDSPFDLF